jgi:hypothetical protein
MNKQKFLDGLLAAAGFACALFLFLPLVVYLLNLGSVATPKMTILLVGGLLAAVTTVFLAAAMFIPRFGRWIVVISQIGLVAVVLLTAFPNRTGEVTGFVANLPFAHYLWAPAKLFVVCGFGAWLAWRKPQVLATLSHYALIVVLLVSSFVAFGKLSTADKADLKQVASGQSAPSSEFTRLGSTANVVVIIFDAFTGYRMTEVLNENPSLRKELAGFVHYPAALASAISTPAGVSAILTGDLKISLTDVDVGARNSASLKDSFLADAKRSGLSTAFISHLGSGDSGIPSHSQATFFNQQPLDIFNRLPAYLGFFSTSLPRIVPGLIASMAGDVAKLIITGNQRAARTDWDLLQSLQSELDRRPQSSKMAMNYFIDNLKVTKQPGSVIVLHSMLSHPPYKLNSNGQYVHDKDKLYEGQSLYAVRELARLCAKLRDLGVYDSTLLIAVADHGAMPVKDKTMGGKFSAEQFRPEILHFNPLLMVKAPGAVTPCTDSAMSVWLGDVAATVRDFIKVPGNSNAKFESRSLLLPDMPQRRLNVPVFTRPDQVHYYNSLAQWTREDLNGTYSDYVAAFTTKPENLLKTSAKVSLFSGVDKLAMDISKAGWSKQEGKQYRAAVEVNGKLVAKSAQTGLVVVSSSNDGYQTQIFSDFVKAEAFLKKITPDRDLLVAGLQVPTDLVGRLFPGNKNSTPPEKRVGFVAVSGPSYGPTPKVLAGGGDQKLEILWKPSAGRKE